MLYLKVIWAVLLSTVAIYGMVGFFSAMPQKAYESSGVNSAAPSMKPPSLSNPPGTATPMTSVTSMTSSPPSSQSLSAGGAPAQLPSNDVALQAPEPMPPQVLNQLILGFAFLSASLGMGSIIVRMKLCSPAYAKGRLAAKNAEAFESPADAEAQGGTPAEVAVAKVLFPGYVASWLMAEAIAIHGITLSQMLHRPGFYFYFGLPAAALLVINAPSLKTVRALTKGLS